jgi:hypothetical protein
LCDRTLLSNSGVLTVSAERIVLHQHNSLEAAGGSFVFRRCEQCHGDADNGGLDEGCVNLSTQLIREVSYLWIFSLDLDPSRMAGLFRTSGYKLGFLSNLGALYRAAAENGAKRHDGNARRNGTDDR